MHTLLFDFNAYTLDVATRLKDIGHSDKETHYIEIDALDALSGMDTSSTKCRPPYLVAVINTDEQSTSEATKRCFYTLMLLDKGSDHVKRKAAKKSAKHIMTKIKAKLKFDQENDLNGLRDLNIESISISSLPLMGEFVGQMMSFWVGEVDADEVNLEDWNE